jgi:hypothetical protein
MFTSDITGEKERLSPMLNITIEKTPTNTQPLNISYQTNSSCSLEMTRSKHNLKVDYRTGT